MVDHPHNLMDGPSIIWRHRFNLFHSLRWVGLVTMTPSSSIPYSYLECTLLPVHRIWIVIRTLYPDRNPDHPQNFINCSLARNTPLVNVSCKSIVCFLSNLMAKQTEWHINQQDQKHNLPGGNNTKIEKIKSLTEYDETLKTQIKALQYAIFSGYFPDK